MFINNSNSFSYSDYEPGVGLSNPEPDEEVIPLICVECGEEDVEAVFDGQAHCIACFGNYLCPWWEI